MSVLEIFLLEPMKFAYQYEDRVTCYSSTSELESNGTERVRYHIGVDPYGYGIHLFEDTIHTVYHSKALIEMSIMLKSI